MAHVQTQTAPALTFPVGTALIVGAALLIHLVPQLGDWLIYDRTAIQSGELWRLLTGNWVHFSSRHLIYDGLALGVASGLLESRYQYPMACICLGLGVFVGIFLFLLDPNLRLYSGLSGIAVGVIVIMSLNGSAREQGGVRILYLACLLLTIAKVVADFYTGQFLLLSADASGIQPVPLSHLLGAVAGAAVFFAPRGKPGANTNGTYLKP